MRWQVSHHQSQVEDICMTNCPHFAIKSDIFTDTKTLATSPYIYDTRYYRTQTSDTLNHGRITTAE